MIYFSLVYLCIYFSMVYLCIDFSIVYLYIYFSMMYSSIVIFPPEEQSINNTKLESAFDISNPLQMPWPLDNSNGPSPQSL